MSERPSTRRSRRSPEEGDEEGRWRTALGDAGPYLGLGMQIALTMAFYVAAGAGLDFWLGTLPLLTILGALAGLGTVLYQVVRAADEMGQRDEPGSDAQSESEEHPKEK
ncbi:MAG: hypothetical protein BRD48_07400 [Bacteroidetes bacterium QS_9_68_14]|nr:MAG: hypothetical protein BRD48_07400 [Bacteroidetes bacterium QS_9_68_14]